ncbi:MAG: hypothetical protein HYT14_01065 [Candidatus Liptonbacteria bacterium]|nr:hypothetical protein [Candidatus Liptonbacteria bacterium]
MEREYGGSAVCDECSEGSCLAHCEVCGSDKSVWGCDYSFPREGREQSYLSFQERGLPEWRCNRPGNPQAIGGAIKFMLIVIGVILLDYITGGWVQSGLSSLWSLIFGW